MREVPLSSREDDDRPGSPPARSLQPGCSPRGRRKTAGTGKPPLGEEKTGETKRVASFARGERTLTRSP